MPAPYCPKCGYAHPHCKCQEHGEGYASGGEVAPPGAIAVSDFVPDPPSASPAQAAPPGLPPGSIPVSEFVSDEDKYGTPGQQAITALEGAGEGVAGPFATGAERLMGVSPEDIRLRRETNPIAHGAGQVAGLAGSMAAGVGLGRVAAGAGELALGATGLKGLAGAAVKTAAELAAIQASDETSRMLMNDPNQSLQTAVADVGLSALIGAGGGALFQAPAAALENAAKSDGLLSQIVGRLRYRANIDTVPLADAIPQGFEPATSQAQRLADSLYEKGINKLGADALGISAGSWAGHATGLPGGAVLGGMLGKQAIAPFLKTVLPAITKPLMENIVNSAGVRSAADYGMSVISGQRVIQNAAKALLSVGGGKALSELSPSQDEINKLDDQLKAYAEKPENMLQMGGQLGHYMPGHAASLGETAERAVQYLNTQRPKESTGLAFDRPIQPTDIQKRDWNRTLSIAQQPMVTFKLLDSNRLTYKDLQTLSTLYPSLYGSMKQQVMNSVIDAKDKGVRVPYQKRVMLSLFLGEPLDSTMTPQALQSFQSTFRMPSRQSNAQEPAAQKSGTSSQKLTKIPALSLTPAQARQRTMQTKD